MIAQLARLTIRECLPTFCHRMMGRIKSIGVNPIAPTKATKSLRHNLLSVRIVVSNLCFEVTSSILSFKQHHSLLNKESRMPASFDAAAADRRSNCYKPVSTNLFPDACFRQYRIL